MDTVVTIEPADRLIGKWEVSITGHVWTLVKMSPTELMAYGKEQCGQKVEIDGDILYLPNGSHGTFNGNEINFGPFKWKKKGI